MPEKTAPVPDDEDATGTHTISVRMPEKTYRMLVKEADANDLMLTDFLRTMFREYFAEDEPEDDDEEESAPKRRRKRHRGLLG